MKKTAFILAALLVSGTCAAMQNSCWVISDLVGPAMYQDKGYSLSADKMSGPIRLTFEGDRAHASGDDAPLIRVGDYMAVGVSNGDTFTMSETYQIDPILGASLYTKSLVARGPFSSMTGIKMLQGKAKRCQ